MRALLGKIKFLRQNVDAKIVERMYNKSITNNGFYNNGFYNMDFKPVRAF